jgi:hypothetical protein
MNNLIKTCSTTKKIILIISLGFIIRLFFMPITLHGDLLFINTWPAKFSFFGIFDSYNYMLTNYKAFISKVGVFYYMPVSYLIISFFQMLYKMFVPNLGQWLSLSEKAMDLTNPLITNQILLHHNTPEIFKYLFFMKTPYLLFDTGLIYLLFKLVPSKKLLISVLWAFNPVLIYGTYCTGQFDLLLGLLILLTIFFSLKNMNYLAIITLGLSIGCKKVPIILMLPTILILGNNWKQYLKLAITAFLTIFIPVGIFYLSSDAVLLTIFDNILKGKAVGSEGIEIVKMLKLSILGLGYCSILFYCFQLSNKNTEHNYQILLKTYLCIFLIMYSLISTAVHYFIWCIPVFIFLCCLDKKYIKYLWILSIMILLYKVKKASMCAGLFAPINPEYFYSLPDLNEALTTSFFKWKNFVKIFRFVFIGCSGWVIYLIAMDFQLRRKGKTNANN